MKKAIIKITSLLLASILILSCAPLDVIADYDFKSAFGTMAKAVNDYLHPCTLGKMSYVTENGELVCIDEDDNGGLFTQASDDLIMTKGETRDVHVAVNDSEGNPINDFGYITWSASPSGSVTLNVHEDTRYCTITVLSDATTITLTMVLHISEKYGGGTQTRTRKITFSGLNFEYPHYYIMVEKSALAVSIGSLITAQADWRPSEDEGITSLSDSHYEFTSSDESILQVTGKTGYGSKTFTLIPKVKGLKEGETTLTVKTSTGEKASCKVTVVGYKEYDVEVFSNDLETPLANASVFGDDIDPNNSLGTQSTSALKTNKEGKTRIRIPDVKYCPNTDLEVQASFHPKKEINVSHFKENEINRLNLDFDMEVEEINISGEYINGPTVTGFDSEFSLFSFGGNIDIPFTKLNFEKFVDPFEKTVKYTLGYKDGYEHDYDSDEDGRTARAKDYNDFKEFYKKVNKGAANKDILNSYNKMRNKLKSFDGSIGVDVTMTIAGYLEFDFSSGESILKDGGIIVSAEAGVSGDYPLGAIAYATFGISGEIEGDFKRLSKASNETVKASTTISISIKPTIGAGVRAVHKDVLSAEVGLEAKLTGSVTIPAQSFKRAFTLYIGGKAYIKLKALWIFKTEWFFDLGKVELYPDFGEYHTSALSMQESEETRMPILSREYLEKLKTNSARDINEESVYPYGVPKLVQTQDGRKIAVYLYDDGTKTDINRSTLYFSENNNGVWSTPSPIFDSGYADFPAEICSDGQNIYAVWQRASQVYEDSFYLDDIVTKTELVYSVYNGKTWSTPIPIDSAGKYQTLYHIATNGNEVAFAWAENSENSYNLSSGTTTIYKKTLSNGVLSQEEIVESSAVISDVAVGYVSNKLSVAYCMDKDGDFNTTGDSEILINGNFVSNDNLSDYDLTYQNGSLYWIKNGVLYTYKSGTEKSCNLLLENDYRIVNNGNDTAVTFIETDGLQNEVMISYLNSDGTYTNPVELTKYNRHITYYDSLLNVNGSVSVLSNIENLNNESGFPYTTTDLVYDDIDKTTDISISDLYIDTETLFTDNICLNGTVSNISTKTVDRYDVYIRDTADNILGQKTFYNKILSGSSEKFALSFSVPKDFTTQDITVTLETNGDVDKTNNSDSFEFGHSDIYIKDCTITENGFITAKISNQGFAQAENVMLDISKFVEENEAITQINVGSVAAGETITVTYRIDEKWIGFDSYLTYNSFNLEVSTTSTEINYANNDKTVLISPVFVTDVSIEKSEAIVEINKTVTISATVYPSNATTKTILWFSDDTEIATVDENGVITGNSLGTTRIKAVTSDGGFVAYCTVTVASSVPVNGITLSQTSGSILVGDTRQLKATVLPDNATNKSVIWSSSNTSVATVTSSGLVTGVKTGTAVITAKTQDGNYSARYTLTVTDVSVSVTGITVSPVQKTLDPNETLQLNATVIPSNATNQKVTWSTSDSSVATVSSNGTVVAKAPGTAVITVKSEDGNFTATCTVTVTSSGYVEKTLVSVSLYSAPTTTSYIYKYSDGIKLDGLKLLATYSDGSTEIISDISKMTVSGFDASKTGTKTISVEYDGLKTEFNVTVSYAWWQWIIRILLLGFLWY